MKTKYTVEEDLFYAKFMRDLAEFEITEAENNSGNIVSEFGVMNGYAVKMGFPERGHLDLAHRSNNVLTTASPFELHNIDPSDSFELDEASNNLMLDFYTEVYDGPKKEELMAAYTKRATVIILLWKTKRKRGSKFHKTFKNELSSSLSDLTVRSGEIEVTERIEIVVPRYSICKVLKRIRIEIEKNDNIELGTVDVRISS